MSMNRTPYPLTQEQQGRFYQKVICNRNANARYWGIWEEETYSAYIAGKIAEEQTPIKTTNIKFIGMGEITNISLENRNGEIGLIMHPGYVYMAEQAVELILEQGFDYLNLENIYGEVYGCSAYLEIWKAVVLKFNANSCYLPCRKFWESKYYDSIHFNINKGDWKACNNLLKI
jgi:hypothetical protein